MRGNLGTMVAPQDLPKTVTIPDRRSVSLSLKRYTASDEELVRKNVSQSIWDLDTHNTIPGTSQRYWDVLEQHLNYKGYPYDLKLVGITPRPEQQLIECHLECSVMNNTVLITIRWIKLKPERLEELVKKRTVPLRS